MIYSLSNMFHFKFFGNHHFCLITPFNSLNYSLNTSKNHSHLDALPLFASQLYFRVFINYLRYFQTQKRENFDISKFQSSFIVLPSQVIKISQF